MRQRLVMVVLTGAAAAWCVAPLAWAGSAAAGAPAAGTWHKAIEVPGSGKLNAGGDAQVASVSCGSAGDCAAGGLYRDGSGAFQAFVVSEVNGRWRAAIEVPGSGKLNAGGDAEVFAVSCASAGNCAAGGRYKDGSGSLQAFVASEVNGRWRAAIEVPGSGKLNAGGSAFVSSLSCASAGNCAVGGSYVDGSTNTQAFVASEVNGRWRAAIEVPGSGKLNAGGNAFVSSLSCASAGNCAAGGRYIDGSGHSQVFVASEVHGQWRAAIEVPGSAQLNAGGTAELESVSCASAGNCAAGGVYSDSAARQQAFVVSEVNGKWRAAIKVPGTGKPNQGGIASVSSVSCASAGNCAAGGAYIDSAAHEQAFTASEVNGKWRAAIEVPGTGKLNAGGAAFVTSVSCASAGNCAAGGSYTGGSGHSQAFVDSEVHGQWRAAIEVPGSGTLNAGGNAALQSVSCASPGNCAAGGLYKDLSGHFQAFVVSQT